MKKTIIVKQCLNDNIKIGDFVRIFDGSAFSVDGQKDLYIVESRPDIFGIKTTIKDIVFKVTETNVVNAIIEGGLKESFYRQDLVLKMVNSDLPIVIRSASELVKKL